MYFFFPSGMEHAWECEKQTTITQSLEVWRDYTLGCIYLVLYKPMRIWSDLQKWGPAGRKQAGDSDHLTFSGCCDLPSFYTSEMSLQQKPSFNLEFNKNWLSITEHKQSCSINLSALFVLGRKQALSAEADDRCWLKDKYYLYFCTRFLLMHILSCMGIWSTKQFYISQRCSTALWLHGNAFKSSGLGFN